MAKKSEPKAHVPFSVSAEPLSASRTIVLEVPIGPLPLRDARVNINDDIHVEMHLDQTQSNALRALFSGLKQDNPHIRRPTLGLIWLLEQIAAEIDASGQ